jgi:hypothetical protein
MFTKTVVFGNEWQFLPLLPPLFRQQRLLRM